MFFPYAQRFLTAYLTFTFFKKNEAFRSNLANIYDLGYKFPSSASSCALVYWMGDSPSQLPGWSSTASVLAQDLQGATGWVSCPAKLLALCSKDQVKWIIHFRFFPLSFCLQLWLCLQKPATSVTPHGSLVAKPSTLQAWQQASQVNKA